MFLKNKFCYLKQRCKLRKLSIFWKDLQQVFLKINLDISRKFIITNRPNNLIFYFSNLFLADHSGRDGIHHFINQMNNSIGGEDVRLHKRCFLAAAMETDFDLLELK